MLGIFTIIIYIVFEAAAISKAGELLRRVIARVILGVASVFIRGHSGC